MYIPVSSLTKSCNRIPVHMQQITQFHSKYLEIPQAAHHVQADVLYFKLCSNKIPSNYNGMP